jgi:RHS repeat-associated protein
MKNYTGLILFLLFTVQLSAQKATDPYNYNYIRTYSPIGNHAVSEKPVHGEADYMNEWHEEVTYFDGLGRPMQQIQIGIAPNGWDMVQPIFYDQFGRVTKEYLAYGYPQIASGTAGAFRDRALLEQEYFYQSSIGENPDYAFAEKVFDGSPLNRVMKQGAAGESWNVDDGHPVEYAYLSTHENYEVYQFSVSSSNSLIKEGCYPARKIYKRVVWDENGNKATEFTDFSGRVIQKEVDINATKKLVTMYVYDDLGLLRFVISPEAFIKFPSGTTPQTTPLEQDWLKQLCYYYEYDKRGRMTMKRLPGKDVEYIVYDDRNRPVLSQDGNLRAENKWLFTKYDALNRPIMSGSYKNTSVVGQDNMQALVDNETVFYETVNASSFYGYTNLAFPVINESTCEVFSVSMYDTYKYYNSQSPYFKEMYGFKSTELDFLFDKQEEFKGQVTTSMVRNLTTNLVVDSYNTDWKITVFYYDKYGNVLQSISNVAFDGFEVLSGNYNFTGQMIDSREHLIFGGERVMESLSVVQAFTYDQAGRLINTTHQFNDDTLVNLSQQVYDKLGRLTTKKLHKKEDELTWKQQIGYRYNIRNWLTGIENNYFTETLGYDITDGTPTYNGNIADQLYEYTGFTGQYLFDYDGANRLTAATHSNTAALSTAYGYDKNGNIMYLFRDGIDSLTYNYKGNQLTSVNDVIDETCQNNGFTDDGYFMPIEYGYDNNGNMLVDANKQISMITYNHMNLPKQINIVRQGAFNSILYKYDASGQKTLKQTQTDGHVVKTTHYIGSFVFENCVLKHVLTGEGLLEPQSGKMVYKYFIKDHLGNNRILFNQDNLVLQQSSYYPFGMLVTPPTRSYYDYNRYLYNGKELQDDFELDWYDYGARMYDPALGRWHNQDPLAQFMSPYVYAANNPISVIDPDGMWAEDVNGNNVIATTVVNEDTGEEYEIDDGFDFVFTVSADNFARIKKDGAIPSDLRSAWAKEFIRQVGQEMKNLGGDTWLDALLQFLVYDDVGDGMINAADGNYLTAGVVLALGSKLKFGKKGYKMAKKLFKYGKKGKFPTPDLNPDQFKKIGNKFIHKDTGAIFSKSHTSHGNAGNVGKQWKAWPKGTTDFGSTSKKAGTRITIDEGGNIIGN